MDKWQYAIFVSQGTGGNGLRSAMSCQGNLCLATGKKSTDISYHAGKNWQVLANQNAKKG